MEMKILQVTQKHLAEIGFAPNQQQSNNRQLSSIQCVNVVICSIDAVLIGAYILCEANDIEEYVNAVLSFTAVVAITISFINIILNNDKTFNNIELCEKELTDRLHKTPSSRAVLENTIRRVEKLSKIIHFAAINYGVPGTILPRTLTSYYIYFTTDFARDAFELPFATWLPFDWKNPIVYFIVIIWQSIAVIVLQRFLACLLPLAIGTFLFAFKLSKYWRGDLRKLNKMVKTKQPKADIFKQVTDIVGSHSNVKQWLIESAKVCEVCVLVDFMGSTIGLCIVMVMIQVEIISKDTVDLMALWNVFFYGIWVFAFVFVVCEIGQRLTDAIYEIVFEFEQLNWYSFPIEIRRMLPTIMMNTQKPITMGCFGIAAGNRDQFKKVINTVYKSFNVLCKIVK